MQLHVHSIKWDTSGDDQDTIVLPSELYIDVPDGLENEDLDDFVSDEISNITGFCHKGFSIEK